MSGLQVLGGAMLAAFLIGLVVMTAAQEGWRVALAIWGSAVCGTSFLALAIFLLAGGAA